MGENNESRNYLRGNRTTCWRYRQHKFTIHFQKIYRYRN